MLIPIYCYCMKQAVLITISILLLNSLFFWLWWYEYINTLPFFVREAMRTVYKVLVYIWPVVACVGICGNTFIFSQIKNLFKWFTQKWVYGIWIGYWLFLLMTQSGFNSPVTCGIFYILIVNSLVEEVVFRGYLQSKPLQKYWIKLSIVLQSLLFAVVHIPLYYYHYSQWLYDTLNTTVWAFLSIKWIWVFIIILLLIKPFWLWIIWWVLTHKTQSLRPSIVMHSIHNWILLFV